MAELQDTLLRCVVGSQQKALTAVFSLELLEAFHTAGQVVCEGPLCDKPPPWTPAANSSFSARPLLLDDLLGSPRKEDRE